MVYGTDTNAFANAWLFVVDNGASDEWPPPPPPMNTLTIMNDRSTTLTIFTGSGGGIPTRQLVLLPVLPLLMVIGDW
jgi:hypothetical protein